MKIAVVILNWNGKSLLRQFLPLVVEYSPEAVIYVADNASEDDSVTFVQQNFPDVGIIQNKENGGYAKGYNDALEHLSEDVFILLNSDVEVTSGWLKPILQEFQENENTAALQPKILDFRHRDRFEYAGAAGGFIDKYAYPYCRGRIFDRIEQDKKQYDDSVNIFWATGACLAIRKEAFIAAGKFDEDFFAHQEEIDLCWRLFNLGHEVRYVGSSVVFHLGGGTLESAHPRKTFYNFRNSLYSLLKNAPKNQVFQLIFVRLLLDGLAGIKFLIDGKPAHILAVIEAHFSFYAHFKRMKNKRENLPKRRKYYHRSSVLYAYYIRQHERFSQL